MLSSGSVHDFDEMKSFHIKNDDKFSSRLVSRESSKANPSSRVYYGDVSGAVPFTWESRPGTPKYTFSDSALPPLTPPPSYYFSSAIKPTTRTNHKTRSKLLQSLFTRIHVQKPAHLTTSPSSSSSLSSLSWSSSYSSFSSSNRRRRFSSWESTFDDDGDEHHHQVPSGSGSFKYSRFCFPLKRNINRSSGIQGANSVVMFKKNFLSMIGCGSG